jgi:hypothetical protein
MTANTSVTATFAIKTFSLVTATTGTGSGTISNTPAGSVFNYGAVVTLTASANTGSTFTGWSGDCAGAGVCVVTMTSNANVTGTFTINTHTLSVATDGGGSGVINQTPAGSVFNYGTVITLTPAPNTGSAFTGWSSVPVSACASAGLGACVFTITADTQITGTFIIAPTYLVTVTRDGVGSGTITDTSSAINCGATCSAVIIAGTVMTFTATADTGSTFTGWSGACSGTGTCIVTISADTTITATFSLNSYTLTKITTGTGSGTIDNTPTGSVFTYGTVVTLTANANAGSTFTGWSPSTGSGCSGTGSCVVTMTADTIITATFSLNSYTLTKVTTGTGSGTISNTPGGSVFTYGTVVTLTANANTGSTFTGWSGACGGTGNCIVTMDADKMVTATFSANDQAITNLQIVGNVTVTLGAATTFTATQATGTNITYTWSVNDVVVGVGSTLPYTFTTAGTYTVTVTARNNTNSQTAQIVVVVADTMKRVYLPLIVR